MSTKKIFIIAEAGVNHNGDITLAKALIDVAYEAKADAVKFQTFKPGEVTGRFAFKVDYQKQTTDPDDSRYEMSRKLALTYDQFRELQQYCSAKGIMFLSTPDGYESLDFLVDELDIPIIKIASTEMTHVQFFAAVAKKKRPVIVSTGLSTLEEVGRAVGILKDNSCPHVTIVQCTSEYPAPYDDVNLRAMVSMGKAFACPVGFSDHTVGGQAAIAAVALGASVIEKHFTVDKSLPGPDHQASLDPKELKAFVEAIRITERVLGDGIKKPMPSEIKNMAGVRRGLVAAKDLCKGIVLEQNMLTFKRPNTGIQPFEIDRVIGKTLLKDMQQDEVFQWEFLR